MIKEAIALFQANSEIRKSVTAAFERLVGYLKDGVWKDGI